MGKKQGMPEALSEAHFAKIRRKAGLPPVEPEAEAAPKNKKRKADGKTNGGAAAKKAKTVGPARAAEKPAKAKAAPKSNGNGKAANGKAKGAKVALADAAGVDGLISDDDDVAAEGLSDLENDDDLEIADDDFAESGSEVYDSDADQGPQRMWSDDESGGEEDLEAANEEGLRMDEDTEEDDDDSDDDDERGLASAAGIQTNIENERPQVLEDADALAEKPQGFLAPDLQVIRQRMTETIRVLDDFAKLAQTGRSRSEYTAQLLKDICAYYGYSEFLAEKMFSLFSPREAFAFFEANETPRPVVIRTNSLRTNRRDLAQALINRGVTLEPVGKWSKVGLQIFESSVPLGATPEYLAGHYILQAASSFLPCVALDPQENDRVLDMSSAPGGKASYLSAMMKNTGLVVANDANKARCKALVGNLHRLGCRNTIVTNLDAREFPKPMGGFDRVLLDVSSGVAEVVDLVLSMALWWGMQQRLCVLRLYCYSLYTPCINANPSRPRVPAPVSSPRTQVVSVFNTPPLLPTPL
jgi:ribosomal RNA methyltransferase Nop2